MATKVINGTHTNTVALATYPTYSDFSLTGVITVAASVGVFGNATKAWTVANSGLVSGTNGLAFSSGGLASTVSNTGTIVGTGTSGIGVLLQSGGSVQNQGLIQGTLQGIRASGGLGIVSNFGTVLSSNGAALALTSGGTVANFSTIASSASYGISLTAGFISNGSTAVTTALISGYRFGIVANPSTTATGVVNYGTIVASATNGKGVLLQSGGNIINGGLISGTVDAVRVSSGSSTVNNAGTVAGITGGGIVLNANGTVFNTGTVTTAQSYAVYVKDGWVSNGSISATTATIIGGNFGILTGTTTPQSSGVVNYGTIAATAGTGTGVVLLAGGIIGNASLISGGGSGISITGGSGSISNIGTIRGLTGNGIYLGSGSLTNGSAVTSTAVVSGYQFGVFTGTSGGAGVVNYGTIVAGATNGQGLLLQSGGSLDNRGLISGATDAVRVTGGSASVNNVGTIAASAAGIVLNGGGTLANTGTVLSVQSYGAYAKYGSIWNGSTAATTAAIIGYTFGVLTGATTALTGIVNFGTIAAWSTSGTGVVLLSGGSVANANLILGAASGISITGGSGTVLSTGTIRGISGSGVYFGGGSLTNGSPGVTAGLISGYTYGVITNGNLAVANHGTVAALGTGGVGVVLGPGNGTLVNSGTIIGNSGHAAYLGGGDLLLIYPQAVFVGKVLVGGPGNTLELAAGPATGILGQFGYDVSGLGTDLSGFGTLIVDAGATWQVAESGGTAHIVTNQGTIVVPTLGMLVTATLTAGPGTLALGTRSSVEIVGAVEAGQIVRFLDTTGTLFLHAPESFAGTIDGFQTGDVIELVSTVATHLLYTGDFSAGTLSVMNGGTLVAALAFSGGTAYSQSAFTLTQAGEAGAGIFRVTLGPPQTISSGGPVYNVIYDDSIANAPAAFFAGFNQAVQFLEMNFVDPISINLEVGWAEVADSPMLAGQLGDGRPQSANLYTYDQVKAALANSSSPSATIAVANLPDQDPTNGGLFYIGGAEAKALGLIPGDTPGLDAAVGLQIDPTLTFFTAGAIHEITTAMGRISLLGESNLYSVIDLFRYTAPGVLDPTAASGAYFSIDGGNTVINIFSDGTGQTGLPHLTDWAGNTPDAFNNPGPLGPVTPGDYIVMEVLGNDVARLETSFSTHDFNGDGNSDMLWQEDNGTGVAISEMDGTQVIGGGFVGYGAAGWHVVDAGDFNGDAKSDILWQEDNGTGVAISELNGTQVIGGGFVGYGAAGWHVVDAGDFNADGKSDILWQENNGTGVAISEMDGTQVIGGGFVGYGAAGWHVVDAGDFNGDAKSDILWQEDNGTGVAISELNGTQVIGGGFVGYGAAGWHVVDTGDFNGDTKSDILWQEDNGTGVAISELDGTQVIGGGFVGYGAAGWHVVDTGDFNGDTKSDILWQEDNGTGVVVSLMDGTQVIGGGLVGYGATGWHIVDEVVSPSSNIGFAFDDIPDPGSADIVGASDFSSPPMPEPTTIDLVLVQMAEVDTGGVGGSW